MSTALLVLIAAAPGPFIDADEARALLRNAVVLDARGDDAKAPYLPKAQVTEWMDIRDGWLRTGRLSDDVDKLRRYFEARGVRDDRPVLVYGAMAEGWGEEGRIWWTLRYLGLDRVYILDGGIAHWVAAGGPTAKRPAPRPRARGRVRSAVATRWRADYKRVDELRKTRRATVLDVRTRDEYDGARPYWSSRGGHVPGARWLHWKSLVGADGKLLSKPALRTRLAEAGVDGNGPVVAYCTGGVRSAFVIAAIAQAGFGDARNYDGSWWDWSRQDVPVERP